MSKYRTVLGLIDENKAAHAELWKTKESLAAEILSQMEAANLDKINADGMTLSVGEMREVAVDPDHWRDFWKWGVDNEFPVLYKRAAVAVHDLAIDGVEIPSYVTLSTRSVLKHRRA